MNRIEKLCAFCHGEGTDPFGIPGWGSTCAVCGGSGLVSVPREHVTCAHCRGTGAVKRFICTVCHGSGVVSRYIGETLICPSCYGTGNDAKNPTLDCLHCRGRGYLPILPSKVSRILPSENVMRV